MQIIASSFFFFLNYHRVFRMSRAVLQKASWHTVAVDVFLQEPKRAGKEERMAGLRLPSTLTM